MSWIQKLYDTYEQCANAPQFSNDPLMPISHTKQQAHIEIVLDDKGSFLRAKAVQKEETTVPATEGSAGRTGKEPAPHPLCDKVRYCASDYDAFGGGKKGFYSKYVALLRRWCDSEHSHRKAEAVLTYVQKGTVVADLIREGILFCDKANKLLTEWKSDTPAPHVFKVLSAKDGKRDQGDAFVRWRVQVRDDPVTAVWEDPELAQAWIRFDASTNPDQGLCMVTGQTMLLATSHPKRLRGGADGAKLISSNDTSGFTFRGRFENAEEACGVGFEITQKAHNALRWLIGRQAYRDKAGGQVFVAWAVGGKQIPDPFKNTSELLGLPSDVPEESASNPEYSGDAGQYLALQLQKLIKGYQGNLTEADSIVVMGLDSATPGRMAITYYRELSGAEFFDRVLAWHESHAWPQRYSKDNQFVGAPAPREIAEAAYGRRLDDKLRKATVERLLPCIVDGRPVPRDVVESCVRRVCNRMGLERWDWEKSLGIACGLFRGYHRKEKYQMSLEEDRNTRDYLFGRLLAIADYTEEKALYLAGEKRDTNAARLMQRFADRPSSTWRTIELALGPYKARLHAKRPGVLVAIEKQLDEVACKFQTSEFTDDGKLTGEFLLGYHCQHAALWRKASKEEAADGEPIHEGEE
jgi:CRISPR-associated protein Csd1